MQGEWQSSLDAFLLCAADAREQLQALRNHSAPQCGFSTLHEPSHTQIGVEAIGLAETRVASSTELAGSQAADQHEQAACLENPTATAGAAADKSPAAHTERLLVQSLVSAAAASKKLGRTDEAVQLLTEAADLDARIAAAHLLPLQQELREHES